MVQGQVLVLETGRDEGAEREPRGSSVGLNEVCTENHKGGVRFLPHVEAPGQVPLWACFFIYKLKRWSRSVVSSKRTHEKYRFLGSVLPPVLSHAV